MDLVQFDEVISQLGTGAVQIVALGPLMDSRFYRVKIEFAP
jgi:O-methyltransferase involved in polyketide biosynthesis